jgi:hypothetical protein
MSSCLSSNLARDLTGSRDVPRPSAARRLILAQAGNCQRADSNQA